MPSNAKLCAIFGIIADNTANENGGVDDDRIFAIESRCAFNKHRNRFLVDGFFVIGVVVFDLVMVDLVLVVLDCGVVVDVVVVDVVDDDVVDDDDCGGWWIGCKV